jgi:hypothetical protein
MQSKNFKIRDPQIEKELKTSMYNQIDANSGINRPKPGAYEIVLAYAEPVFDNNPLKIDNNDKTGFSLSNASSFIARIVLQGAEDQMAFLALPCDEYSIDTFSELIGKKVISNGESFCIYGDRCTSATNPVDLEKENLISPFFMNNATRRHDFFNGLGMLRSEFLAKGQEYTIKSALLSEGINKLNGVARRFIDVKISPEPEKEFASGTISNPSDTVTLRVYFNKLEEAQQQRTLGFFSLRAGKKFTPKKQIPTMIRPINMILFLQQFVSDAEAPLMQVGKIYVLDYSGEKNEDEAYIVFHDIEINKQVEECDKSILSIPGVKIASIRGFPKSDSANSQIPKHMEGRTVSDIIEAFNPKKENSPKRIFSVSEDIYDGMLDYVNFRQMRLGLELFSFKDFNGFKEDEVTKMRSMSLARNSLRSEAMRQHFEAGLE